MLQKQDDRRDRELAGHGCDELRVDDRRADVLEASRNSLEDLDRILSSGSLAMPAVEPRRNRQDHDDEGVPEHREEEEQSLCKQSGQMINLLGEK